MLTILLLHIIITCISLCAGFLFYETLPGKKSTGYDQRPVIFYLVSGLISVTLILQIIVLFKPITVSVQAILLVIVVILLLIKKKKFGHFLSEVIRKCRNQPTQFFLGVCSYWLLILILNAGPTMMDDTESYHIQLVKW